MKLRLAEFDATRRSNARLLASHQRVGRLTTRAETPPLPTPARFETDPYETPLHPSRSEIRNFEISNAVADFARVRRSRWVSFDMQAHCQAVSDGVIQPGDYGRERLLAHSGASIEGDGALLDRLAVRIMDRYESRRGKKLLALGGLGVRLATPSRTKRFYRRLFDDTGQFTSDFVTTASETLGHWIEECFGDVDMAEMGSLHGTEPAYDVIELLVDAQGVLRLRLVQVKATEANLNAQCSTALKKFKRLEAGDYDAELLGRLTMLQDAGRIPDELDIDELWYDGFRHYRVLAVHGPSTLKNLLAKYDHHLPGVTERRSLHLVGVTDWSAFWQALASRVYANLT